MALDFTTINPRVIFTSATTPSDTTEGKLWYNTSENSLYVSDGSSYVTLESDTDNLNQLIQENSINILINSAGASTTLNDWEDMILDRFTDADGQLNSVDTGNTTASFSTNKYTNPLEDNVSEGHTPTSSAGNTPSFTTTFTALGDEMYLKSIGLASGGGAQIVIRVTISQNSVTLAQKDFNFTNTTTASFSISDFSDTIKSTVAGGVFTVSCARISGVATNIYRKISSSYSGTLYSYTTQETATNFTFTSLQEGSGIIQTDAQTIDAGTSHVQIYSNNTTTGTGTVTADISLDGGSTWTEGIALNTKTALTSTDGTSLIMKLNLNAGASAGTSEAEDYAIMLFY